MKKILSVDNALFVDNALSVDNEVEGSSELDNVCLAVGSVEESVGVEVEEVVVTVVFNVVEPSEMSVVSS